MEYRRVVQEFRIPAAVLQCFILGCACAYFAYQLKSIAESADSPPVDVRMEPFRNFSQWALCAHPSDPDGDVSKIGVGVQSSYTAIETLGVFSGMDETFSKQLLSTVYNQTVLFDSTYGNNLTCAIVDAESIQGMLVPGTFTLCSGIGPYGWLLVKSDGGWQFVNQFAHAEYHVMKLSSYVHGFNSGYTVELQRFFSAQSKYNTRWWGRGGNISAVCQWKQSAPASMAGTVFVIVVEDRVITKSVELGMLPQLFSLLSSLGGLMGLAGLAFTTIFVKKYPYGDSELRTLIGNAVKQDGAQLEEGLFAQTFGCLGSRLSRHGNTGAQATE
ncbi:ftsH [Symbiodinium natans]|uniref:FtsH protein n=1 Tax=Symbiodinium natans TaxID=878477 RepID=A0A812PLR4_9DINO|nr:ftsH [Symbiodinium natans]